ncbi:hypothetical protein RI129_012567 [Pyrocoelia pectoralis]|uniref:Uncharacterized protein n=1 Tax=Pyrocoelia pectoralis TaxID=417401 RepID=A0AAN7ZC73_9COLE
MIRFMYVICHYWKEYKGEVPIDAFSAGTDKEGKPVYVGQIFMHGYGLLPATIVPGSNVTFASSQKQVIETNKDIKILCSLEGTLRWYHPKISEELFCSIVKGGSEVDQVVHIGRAIYKGETVLGRVFSYWDEYKGMWIAYNGKQVHITRSYEILNYNCIQ